MRLHSIARWLFPSAAVLALAACTSDAATGGANQLADAPSSPSSEESADPGATPDALEAEPTDPAEPLAPDTDPPKPDEGMTDEEIDKGMDPPPAGDYALPAIPAACKKAQVLTYTPRGVGRLLTAFEKDHTPCADYFMYLPALVADKTQPRGGASPKNVRARAGRFHAVAEFHWQTWKNVPNMTWYQRGVEFRRRMEAAGYNIARGDTWAINELPSTIRTDAATRTAVRNVVKGLYDGPAGAAKRAGAVLVIGFAHDTQNVTVLKTNTKNWLEDTAFWQTMDANVLYWGQEAYAKPAKTCVGTANQGTRAAYVNDFGMHPAKLAAAGPASVAAAKKFFGQAYYSLLTASWKQDLYGETNISLDQMKRFVSTEVYAQKAFGSTHEMPDGRIGLSFHDSIDGTPLDQIESLAASTAASISGAYAVDGTAAKACSATGALEACTCNVAGASFNDLWNAFETY